MVEKNGLTYQDYVDYLRKSHQELIDRQIYNMYGVAQTLHEQGDTVGFRAVNTIISNVLAYQITLFENLPSELLQQPLPFVIGDLPDDLTVVPDAQDESRVPLSTFTDYDVEDSAQDLNTGVIVSADLASENARHIEAIQVYPYIKRADTEALKKFIHDLGLEADAENIFRYIQSDLPGFIEVEGFGEFMPRHALADIIKLRDRGETMTWLVSTRNRIWGKTAGELGINDSKLKSNFVFVSPVEAIALMGLKSRHSKRLDFSLLDTVTQTISPETPTTIESVEPQVVFPWEGQDYQLASDLEQVLTLVPRAEMDEQIYILQKAITDLIAVESEKDSGKAKQAKIDYWLKTLKLADKDSVFRVRGSKFVGVPKELHNGYFLLLAASQYLLAELDKRGLIDRDKVQQILASHQIQEFVEQAFAEMEINPQQDHTIVLDNFEPTPLEEPSGDFPIVAPNREDLVKSLLVASTIPETLLGSAIKFFNLEEIYVITPDKDVFIPRGLLEKVVVGQKLSIALDADFEPRYFPFTTLNSLGLELPDIKPHQPLVTIEIFIRYLEAFCERSDFYVDFNRFFKTPNSVNAQASDAITPIISEDNKMPIVTTDQHITFQDSETQRQVADVINGVGYDQAHLDLAKYFLNESVFETTNMGLCIPVDTLGIYIPDNTRYAVRTKLQQLVARDEAHDYWVKEGYALGLIHNIDYVCLSAAAQLLKGVDTNLRTQNGNAAKLFLLTSSANLHVRDITKALTLKSNGDGFYHQSVAEKLLRMLERDESSLVKMVNGVRGISLVELGKRLSDEPENFHLTSEIAATEGIIIPKYLDPKTGFDYLIGIKQFASYMRVIKSQASLLALNFKRLDSQQRDHS